MSATGGKSKGNKNKNRRHPPKNKPEEVSPVGIDTVQNSQDQLDRELVWCVQQLAIGLNKPNQKLTHKQGTQAVEALRALNNPKTPLVKKRQVMRVNFGDYRKKMAEEEKQYYSNLKTPSIEQSTGPSKSIFLKKSVSVQKREEALKKAASGEEKDQAAVETSQAGASGFKFNFKVDTEDTESKPVEEPKTQSKPEDAKSEVQPPALNYFKMVPCEGETTFRFNFKIDKDMDE